MNGTANRPYKLREDALDPLSRKDWWQLRKDPQQDPILMRSQETSRMIVDLRRYCRGEKEGVSILVAGPRGAGKTTLVKFAVRQLIVESGSERFTERSRGESERLTEGSRRDSGHLIPLPIFLHGPTILDHEAEAGGPRPRFGEEPSSEEGAEIVKRRAIQLIITELYRELCRVFYDAWCCASEEAPTARRTLQELLELRTHLDLGLDWAPQPRWLRSIWARAGFLHSGVAFYLVPGLRHAAERRRGWLRPVVPPQIAGPEEDQGLREIRAITACADAYRVIIAEMKEKIERTTSDETKQQSSSFPAPQASESGSKPSEKGGDDKSKLAVTKLAPPALGTLAGGVTLFSQNLENLLFAAIAGGAVWLVSWLAMFYNVQRRSSLETRRTQTVDIKWDVPRIERDFPKLLARVKDAGFAPIFVLDELDKTKDAKKKLERFLMLTKHFATGEAAFIFLTNRDYYETLFREQYENRVSTTFFTYRIFVRYDADEYRHFLLQRFGMAETAIEQHDATDRYRLGLAAWATILVYRSNMLAHHFNRQLMLLVDEKGEFKSSHQDPDLPLSATIFRQEVVMQLAIEAVARDPKVQEYLQGPYAQQVFDTLYYIRELRESGETHHRITPDRLRTHLWQRARSNSDPMPADFLSGDEINFLFGLVGSYIGLLRRPRRIKEETIKSTQPAAGDDYKKRLLKRLVRGLASAIDDRPLVT
jgi:energy-coupling factor transporter ATP-binding protein EcfA2